MSQHTPTKGALNPHKNEERHASKAHMIHTERRDAIHPVLQKPRSIFSYTDIVCGQAGYDRSFKRRQEEEGFIDQAIAALQMKQMFDQSKIIAVRSEGRQAATRSAAEGKRQESIKYCFTQIDEVDETDRVVKIGSAKKSRLLK